MSGSTPLATHIRERTADGEDIPLGVATFYDKYGEREWERRNRDFHHRLE